MRIGIVKDRRQWDRNRRQRREWESSKSSRPSRMGSADAQIGVANGFWVEWIANRRREWAPRIGDANGF
ncbi:hypothetical protein SO802_028319 [Lithocarpus litseifolius]|uniref:Uncharacterized protein n=1 Tax=Lithocarpus litseifolius TaxID=425828 RepID=A0AAW2BVE1_9ROSI